MFDPRDAQGSDPVFKFLHARGREGRRVVGGGAAEADIKGHKVVYWVHA